MLENYQLLDDLLLIQLGLEEDLDQAAKGGRDHCQRILQQDCSQSSSKYDDGCRWLQDLGERAAFPEQQVGDDAANAPTINPAKLLLSTVGLLRRSG